AAPRRQGDAEGPGQKSQGPPPTGDVLRLDQGQTSDPSPGLERPHRVLVPESPMLEQRIRRPDLMGRIITPDDAAAMVQDGMTVGMSGFTRAGDAKAVPLAMA